MQMPQVMAELSRLFTLEVEAVQAYARAVPLLGNGPIHDQLGVFGLEHQRHALVLEEHIARRGYYVPDVDPKGKGIAIGALTAPARSLTVEDVLAAIRGNEQLTGALYARVLGSELPGDIRETLERIQDEERTHLERVERAISERGWERGWEGRGATFL